MIFQTNGYQDGFMYLLLGRLKATLLAPKLYYRASVCHIEGRMQHQ